jgi:hypothetical protein
MAATPDYESPYIQAAISAYLNWYAMEWTKYSDRPLKTAFVPNVADMRKAKDVVKSISPPMLLASIARLEINSVMGGAAKKFHKITTGINQHKGTSVVRSLIPIKMGLLTNFRTDNGADISKFIQMMLLTYPGTTFYFEDDTNLRVACRVYVDDGADFPQSDISNAGDMFLLEPVVSMSTYIGTREDRGLIREIRVKLNEGTGGIISTVSYDALTGEYVEIEPKDIKYTDPFDRTSTQWKGE